MLSSACHLSRRSLLFVRGSDRYDFLQPLISNDLESVKNGGVIWAAHLTPQGKFACDLFIGSFDDVVILEVETDFIKDFYDILQKLKLRADVEFAFGDAFKVWALPALPESKRYGFGLAFGDVRSADLGFRFWGREEDFDELQKAENIKLGDDNDYHALRIHNFVPENSAEHNDLIRGKTLLLEAGFDSLGGIDWEKGCYVGQELTARTKYRGLVKKCLVAVLSDTAFASDEVTDSGGAVLGDIRSRAMTADGKHIAIAGLRLNDLDKDLFCAGASLQVMVPDFLHRA